MSFFDCENPTCGRIIRITQRTMTFLWIGICGGMSIVKEFFKHPLPRGDIRRYPPRFLDGCKHTCSLMHTARSVGAYFWRTAGLCSLPLPLLTSSPFLHSALSLREHVTLLTAQDAKGNIYRLAGKAKRFAFQAFHRYPPSVSSDCVFMRAEIPENKSRHTPGHSFLKVDDTVKTTFKISWAGREIYKIDHQLLFTSFDIKYFSVN